MCVVHLVFYSSHGIAGPPVHSIRNISRVLAGIKYLCVVSVINFLICEVCLLKFLVSLEKDI